MADVIAPSNTVTFTITRLPPRDGQRKTIRRLMRMQPEIQKGLRRLSDRRRRFDNVTYRRAGGIWVNRAKATRLTRVEPGESFTLTITPQIIPDIRSVEKYLDAKKAKSGK